MTENTPLPGNTATDKVASAIRGLRENGTLESNEEPLTSHQSVPQDSPPAAEYQEEPSFSDKAQRRFQQLANENAQAKAWAQQMAAENNHLRQTVQNQMAQAQQQAIQNQQVKEEDLLKKMQFKEPYPEEGSEGEQRRWEIRKEAHDIAVKQTYQGISSFAKMLAPTLAGQAQQKTEQAWGQVQGTLAKHGIPRQAIEGTVNAIMQREPHRSLRSAVFDAMDMHGYLGTARKPVPTLANPGQGRQVPAAQPEPQYDPIDDLRGLMETAKAQGSAGMTAQSEKTLAEVFRMGRKYASD